MSANTHRQLLVVPQWHHQSLETTTLPRVPKRWRSSFSQVLIVIVVIVLVASTAHAEQTSSMSGEDLEAAQLHFDWGIHHVENENWREGLGEFDASIAAVPNRSALFNRALCLRNLGLYNESVRAFEEYLTFLGDDVDDGLRGEARAHVEAMQQGSAQVLVRVNVPNATIMVDQHEVGQSPLESPLLLPSGSYQITVTRQGYQTATRPVQLSSGQDTALDIELLQARGSLRFASSIPGAVVWIDGGEAGTTNQQFLLEPGPHHVVVRARRHEPFEQRVDIEPGGQHWIEPSLERRSRRRIPRSLFWALTGMAASSLVTSFILLGPSENAYYQMYSSPNFPSEDYYHSEEYYYYSYRYDMYLYSTITVGIFTTVLALSAFVFSFFTNWRRPRRERRSLRGMYQGIVSSTQPQFSDVYSDLPIQITR